jgi:DNA repair protein RadC
MAIYRYLERLHNPPRRHSSLGLQSPIKSQKLLSDAGQIPRRQPSTKPPGELRFGEPVRDPLMHRPDGLRLRCEVLRFIPPLAVQADLPRERLWVLGPGALTAAELLALILGTGRRGENALALASALLGNGSGSLRRLAARPPAELLRVPGVGPAKGARLLAALELGHRLGRELRPPSTRIREPQDVVRWVAPRLRDLAVEEFHVLALDTQSRVLRDIPITRGLLDSSLVHPREVFRAAIAEAAAGVILVHNHPSGDPTPSAEDRAVTRQLAAAGQVLDLPVYDHVIVAGDRFTSFAQAGLL